MDALPAQPTKKAAAEEESFHAAAVRVVCCSYRIRIRLLPTTMVRLRVQ